jgi:hypothetical protein
MSDKQKRSWPVENPHKKILPTHLLFPGGTLFYLLQGLIFLLVIYPYLEGNSEELRPWILTFFNLLVMTGIIFTVSINLRQRIISLLLGLPSVTLFWLGHPYSEALAFISTGILYIYAILLIFPYLIHSEKIGAEEVFALITLYILLGLTWTIIFQVIEWNSPGSFYMFVPENVLNEVSWEDFLFFSFTTLTTLGYGDIIPLSTQARSLSILEAISGVVFLAIMGSRIIGLYIQHSLKEKKNSIL